MRWPRWPALVAWVLSLGGCGGEEPGRPPGPPCSAQLAAAPQGRWGRLETAEGARWLVRADGTRARVPEAPRRIVSTLPSLTELVAHLAGSEVLVGVSPHCNFPPEVLSLPKVSVLPVDVEGLRALRPDLVLCDADFHAQSLELLERHRIPALMVESRSLAHLDVTIDVLAQVLGGTVVQDRALLLRQRLSKARDSASLSQRVPPQRVLLVDQTDPLNVLGPGSLLDDMLRACGCVNVACDLGRPSAPFSEESVLMRAPDWILTTWEPLPERLRMRWARLPALARGQVVLAAADDLLRPGPRTPEALERLAAVLSGRLAPELLAPRR